MTVQSEVLSGGGSVETPSATTNSQGEASAGKWTLGTFESAQTLRARIAGVAMPTVFTAQPLIR